ncbi:MAG: tetratricopeptide repeat protein, partial [Actinomycetota bacterium]|nr:tetratricopeptide repeat protein [Actinomycetota bacterium]
MADAALAPPTPVLGDLMSAATEALGLALREPGRASALAATALAKARAGREPAAASVAERALGLAARSQHRLAVSENHLRRAVRTAESAGLPELAGEARMSLVGTLALRGEWDRALREADTAAAALRGLPLARLEATRANVHRDQGRLDEALEGFRRALPVFRRHGDRLWEANTHTNRGLTRFQRGDLAGAEADLRRAEEIYVALDQAPRAAMARQNLGLVVAVRGDIPEALAWFDSADEELRRCGHDDAMGLTDRSEAFLAAGLTVDARQCAARAVEALAREGRSGYLAIAQLKLAEAALAEGDVGTART